MTRTTQRSYWDRPTYGLRNGLLGTSTSPNPVWATPPASFVRTVVSDPASTIGPVLTRRIRYTVAERIVITLKTLASPFDFFAIETWKTVCAIAGIAIKKIDDPEADAAHLFYEEVERVWMVILNTAMSIRQQCRAIVHELAHYYLRTADPVALCGHEVIYHMGDVSQAHHDIARRVERRVLR